MRFPLLLPVSFYHFLRLFFSRKLLIAIWNDKFLMKSEFFIASGKNNLRNIQKYRDKNEEFLKGGCSLITWHNKVYFWHLFSFVQKKSKKKKILIFNHYKISDFRPLNVVLNNCKTLKAVPTEIKNECTESHSYKHLSHFTSHRCDNLLFT